MKRLMFLVRNFLIVSVILNVSGYDVQSQTSGFSSFTEFSRELNRLGEIPDSAILDKETHQLWENLRQKNQVPFRIGDSVAFLFKGRAANVSWTGDFTGWRAELPAFKGSRIGLSDLWAVFARFPSDARLDYKIVVDGSWILDPDNPNRQMSGMGPNSELQMPDWKFPRETMVDNEVMRGSFSGNYTINSEKLKYPVNYRVYTPYNYASQEGLPVVYVTDGHEYADEEKGAMLNILDNLIYSGEIRPVIAIFIDPREPGNEKHNRRMSEYVCSQKFADFVGSELVPLIDHTYRTHACPDDRMILGTSLGGMNSAWFGAVRMDDFHLLGINSPAFNNQVLQRFGNLDWYPFRVYMTTGVVYDTQSQALAMKEILDKNRVDYVYKEVNEGHSWGNWRALLADMLRWFFPAN